jgi:hypothetical protein
MQNRFAARILAAFLLAPFLALSSARAADETFFDVPLDSLTIIEGKLPVSKNASDVDWRRWTFAELLRPYVVLDGPGEAYVAVFNGNIPAVVAGGVFPSAAHIVIHTPGLRDITGRMYLQSGDLTGMVELKFKAESKQANPAARPAFYRVMESHYESLLASGDPGAAWFRHKAREARKALGGKEDPNNPTFNARPANLDDTFSLFSGNQALAENLQLDKALPAGAAQKGEEAIDVDSLKGIGVAAIDWTKHIKDKKPALDPLAAAIPADQHAIFFHTFNAMLALADEADRDGTPLLQMAETRSEDAGTRYRYERQLGLSLTGLGRLLGPRLISSVAITGSDPYLRGGSDVAILFAPKEQGEALKSLLIAQVNAARQFTPAAIDVSGKIGSISFAGLRSPDRALCSYLAELKDGTVVISNSEAQLARLAAVQDRKAEALSAAPEFIFFRDRYKLGDEDESALLVLSDATIRRWCSARWRIADSRRTRAAAVMADLNVRHFDALVGGKITPGEVYGEFPVPALDDLHMSAEGASSATYGSLRFLTPISEMKFDKVTVGEAEAYKRWKNSYETNWRGFFDPIAVRFSVSAKKVAADVTVMPLIAGTDYREFVEITSGAKIDPESGDPHDALVRAGMALNKNSAPVKRLSEMAMTMAPKIKIDPLGWVGQSIWFYTDKDPFWNEWAEAKDPNDFVWKNLHRAPLAVQVEVSNGFQLAAFLVAFRAYVDQTVPGLTTWENLTYKDQPYVKIGPTDKAHIPINGIALYYRATGDSLLLTLNEPMLKRSIDRQIERDVAKKEGKPLPPASQPVRGSSLVMQADGKWFDILEGLGRTDYQALMQKRSWSNIPILNEWKHRYPDQDPLRIYQRFFSTRLIDPAGGEYSWNEKWQTMESSVYGSPAQPKTGPPGIAALKGLLRANLGVTFENDGLRARGEVEREK